MVIAAIILMGIGLLIVVAHVSFTVGRNSMKRIIIKKRKNDPEGVLPIIHPMTGRFCIICGVNQRETTVIHDEKQHEIPKPRYCDICGAGPGEKCDAGLHG